MKIHPLSPLLRFMWRYDDVAMMIFASIVYAWLFLP